VLLGSETSVEVEVFFGMGTTLSGKSSNLISALRSGLVRFFGQIWKDRDWDLSLYFKTLQKTELDHDRPALCGFHQLQDWF